MYIIEKDPEGNYLPESFKLEYLVNIGHAVDIDLPTRYYEGLILRYERCNEEKIVYIDSEKLFKEIMNSYEDINSVLDWGIMDIEALQEIAIKEE